MIVYEAKINDACNDVIIEKRCNEKFSSYKALKNMVGNKLSNLINYNYL